MQSRFGIVCAAEKKLDVRRRFVAKLRLNNAASDDVSCLSSEVAHEQPPLVVQNANVIGLQFAEGIGFADTVALWHSVTSLIGVGDFWGQCLLQTCLAVRGRVVWYVEEARLCVTAFFGARVEATECTI